MEKDNQEKGITLVSLVVTIIILLILAGVAISMITGAEGLFAKANNAATKYNQVAKEEAEMINKLLSGNNIGGGVTTPDNVDTSAIDKKMVTQEISFQDSIATIMNPDRGWYRPFTVMLGSNADIQTQCSEATKENIQIIHLRINLMQLSGNVNTDGIDKEIT